MFANGVEGCCALQVISELDALRHQDEYSKEEALDLGRYLRREEGFKAIDMWHGSNITASIVTISPLDLHKAEFACQRAALKANGMKLLGKFPGEHKDLNNNKPYWIELWGSKEFKTTTKRRVKK